MCVVYDAFKLLTHIVGISMPMYETCYSESNNGNIRLHVYAFSKIISNL